MSLPRLILLWLVAGGLNAYALAPNSGADETTRWTMLMVTPNDDVADCHLIRFPDGRIVLIDAGKLGDSHHAVLDQLKAQHITALDLVIISHWHIDHYGALEDIMEAGIAIKAVAGNVPAQASANLEIPWGTNLAHVSIVLKKLADRHIPYFTPRMGERLIETRTAQGTPVSLEVICRFDGLHSPLGLTNVNDTSMIIRLSHGSTRALFTGDAGPRLGDYLVRNNFDLRADIIKTPHHGAEGAPSAEFFDQVEARAMLVSCPKSLWSSPRNMRIRNYYIEHTIPSYVSSMRGNVTVNLMNQGFTIETER